MDRRAIDPDQEQVLETRELLKAAFARAEALDVHTVLDEVADMGVLEDLRNSERIIRATRDGHERLSFDPSKDIVLRVPDDARQQQKHA
jgi:hypothetical protein